MRFQAASLSLATYFTAQRRLGNHVVNPEEEEKKAAVGRICRKKGFKSGMKEREWVMEN